MNIRQQIARFAEEALIYEVSATPKPGLVDRADNGSHDDMDFFTFMTSILAISPYFRLLAEAGYEGRGKSQPKELFKSARKIGISAEKAMFGATCGVNTHKGAIFTLGLVCLSAGYLSDTGRLSADDICETIAEMTAGLSTEELAVEKNHASNGEKVYSRTGATGARGEAESGFATVRRYSLPALRKYLSAGCCINDALVRTLMCIMSETVDTNVINRASEKVALQLRSVAKKYIDAPLADISGLNTKLIEKNISPGGCADLLAVTWLLYKIENMNYNIS